MRFAAAFIVALTLPALAAQGPEGTAILRGRVIDAVSGKPIPNAAITLYPQRRLPHTPGIDPELPKRSTITDPDGAFEVPRLAAGDYAISGSGARYLPIVYGASRPGGVSKHVTVAEAARIDITIRAWPAAAIAGHVYDERGRPVIGAEVRIFAKEPEVWGNDRTDDRGAYEIRGVSPGSYAVAVPVSLSNRTLSASPGRQAVRDSPWRFAYILDRALRTILVSYTGPFPASAEDGRPQVYMTAFAGGARSKETAAYMTLAAGDIREGVDITLPAVRGTRVSGIVTAPSAVAGTILTLAPERSDGLRDDGRIDATAAADGTFVFIATPPGKYLLTAFRRNPPLTEVTLNGGSPSIAHDDYMSNDSEDLWSEMAISIGDGDIDNLVVTLRQGTLVTGRIVLEDDAAPAPPRRRQSIVLAAADGRDRFSDRYLTPQPDGTISTRIRPGKYRPLSRSYGQDPVLKAVSVTGRDLADGPLIVGADPLLDVRFQFGRYDTALRGAVVDSNGSAVADATVILFPADRDMWLRIEESGRARVERAGGGAYRISGMPPGDYLAVALQGFRGGLSDRMVASLADSAVRVTVQAGEPATLSLVVKDPQ